MSEREEAAGTGETPAPRVVGEIWMPPLLNCPKCRNPIGLEVEVCLNCGVRVEEMPSVDRPSLARAPRVP